MAERLSQVALAGLAAPENTWRATRAGLPWEGAPGKQMVG